MYFISWLIIWYEPEKIYLKISIHHIATDFLFDRYSISVTRKIEFRGTEIDKMVQIDNGMSLSELYYCASALIIGWHFSEFYLCNQLVVQLHVTNNQSLVAYRNKKRVQSAMCGMLNSNQSYHANFIEHAWQNHYNQYLIVAKGSIFNPFLFEISLIHNKIKVRSLWHFRICSMKNLISFQIRFWHFQNAFRNTMYR